MENKNKTIRLTNGEINTQDIFGLILKTSKVIAILSNLFDIVSTSDRRVFTIEVISKLDNQLVSFIKTLDDIFGYEIAEWKKRIDEIERGKNVERTS